MEKEHERDLKELEIDLSETEMLMRQKDFNRSIKNLNWKSHSIYICISLVFIAYFVGVYVFQ